MGYRIYADSFLIHDDRLEELKIFEPSLDLEVNKTGSFSFSIYPDHSYYSFIAKIKTIITVYQDNTLLFRGRVLDMDFGFYNEKLVSCEGELAFLYDSMQRPYDFTGSVEEYFTLLISMHNSQVEAEKQFKIGNVTVTDPNDYIVRSNIDHVKTWEEIEKKLLELLGGHLWTRHEEDGVYIDYLKEFTTLSSQKIEFGENLIDLKKISKGGDIVTALIPLGAKLKDEEGNDTDVRLGITSVNNGLDYIVDQDAVDKYGWICDTVIFDDVTEAANLLTKGTAHLAGLVNPFDSIELSAADLAKIDKTVGTFKLGSYVQVISKPHGVDQLFLISKQSIKLFDPAANKLTLGGVLQGFSSAVQGISNDFKGIRQDVEKVAENTNTAVYNVERNLEASIQIAEQNIQQTVAERYYLKDETDSLVSEVSSRLEQTAAGFEMQFTQFSADVDSLAAGTDAEFELLRRYIRFVDGSILLGQEGNELELQISNDRISFMQSGTEVAYFSNNKLYVTDAEIIHSLQLGNFAFLPRTNGNISFKKL